MGVLRLEKEFYKFSPLKDILKTIATLQSTVLDSPMVIYPFFNNLVDQNGLLDLLA